MEKKIKKLTTLELQKLKSRYHPLRFSQTCDLFYESQIPNTGIVLLKGQLGLLKKKKILKTLEPGSLIGINNIVHNRPSKVSCKVLMNSELIMINKSEILDAISEKDPELYDIIWDIT